MVYETEKKKEMAVLYYASGWKLKLPATALGPRLFLEWLEIYQREFKSIPQFRIRSDNESAEPLFVIELPHLIRETVKDLIDYINSNI